MRLLLLASAIFYGNIHGIEKSECCYSKTVGNYSYTLVNSSMPVPSQCMNDCVYIQDDQPDHIYCFEIGKLPVHCSHKDEHCLDNSEKQTEPLKKVIARSDISVVRISASSMTEATYELYNIALEALKNLPQQHLYSFENIANYHGNPKMCNYQYNTATKFYNNELGDTDLCCMNHNNLNFGGMTELFTPWHRLYMVQMERALIAVSNQELPIPYWDWTKEDEMPGLAKQGQWESGVIKGLGKNTERNFQKLKLDSLVKGVETAYEQETTKGFNDYIDIPHGEVHADIGGSMLEFEIAAYDPIFYLHHSEVDRQYAFWQELQKIRKISINFRQSTWQMQPFVSDSVNPFEITKGNPTAPEGLDYIANFHYEYDTLLFQGMTPQEFLQKSSSTRAQPRLYAGLTKKVTGITSKQYFDLMKGPSSIKQEIGYITSFGSKQSSKIRKNENFHIILHDVTNLLENPTTDPLDQALFFSVSKYEDIKGNPLSLENTYKPTAIYRKANTETYVIRIHVDHIELYSPIMEHCHLDSVVEFLNPDGSFSNQVTLVSQETTNARTINGEFPIKKFKNQFRITKGQRANESTYINIGYDPNCHLQCDQSGIPTTGHPDIYLIPWNLNWIKCHENKVSISSCEYDTVILAWCFGQQTDIVEVSNKKDFDDCTNLATTSVAVTDNVNADGYIAIQNTKGSVGTFYYASKSFCKFGFKITIEVEECHS